MIKCHHLDTFLQKMSTLPSQEIGLRLKEERKLLGLTQEELANKLAIRRGTQIRYENGSRTPSAEYLANAANIGIDLVYVLTGLRHQAKQLDLLMQTDFQELGIEFTLDNDNPSPSCTDCTKGGKLCRLKLINDASEGNEENDSRKEAFVPEGNFPWSQMSSNKLSSLTILDPAITNRERALAETIQELEYIIEVDFADYKYQRDMRLKSAQLLCQLFHLTKTPQ
jgi:transcriptional regulator with XRE-family HTH domain